MQTMAVQGSISFFRAGVLRVTAIIVAVVFFVIVVLAALDIPLPGFPAESAAPAKVTYSASAGSPAVTFSLVAPPDHMIAGQTAPIELLFTNSTAKPVVLDLSWTAGCFSVSPEQPAVIEVPASSSAVRKLDVTPLCDQGAHPLLFDLRPISSDLSFDSLASVAPIQLSSGGNHFLARFFFLVAALLQTLAIPAALALLAYFLQKQAADAQAAREAEIKAADNKQVERDRLLKEAQEARDRKLKEEQEERDRLLKDAQDARDRKLKEEADTRARRESILRLRLQPYFTMVQKHYLPISRRMDSIESEAPNLLASITGPFAPDQRKAKIEELQKLLSVEAVEEPVAEAAEAEVTAPQTAAQALAQAAARALAQAAAARAVAQAPSQAPLQASPQGPSVLPEELWKLLVAILLYRARFLSLAKEAGGIYFRSNQAERVFRDLVQEFFNGIYANLTKEKFSEAVALLDPEDELPAALIKCKSGFLAKKDDEAEANRKKELFAGLYESLKQWILADPAEFRAYTRLVQLSSRILDFECDRPFYQTDPVEDGIQGFQRKSGWYFDPPLLDFSPEMYEFPTKLRTELDPEMETYINHLPQECRVGPAFPFPRPSAQPAAAIPASGQPNP
jgi:hypothetical protein